jgi:GT2 family glycosyltransferase
MDEEHQQNIALKAPALSRFVDQTPTSAGSPDEANQYGFIDYYGFSRSCKGWWLGGWIPFPLQPDRLMADDLTSVTLSFRKQEEIMASGRIALFDRDDIKDLGRAFLLFVAAPPVKDILFVKAEITLGEFVVPLRLGALADHLREPAIVARSRSDLGIAPDSDEVAALRQLLLSERGPDSTLGELKSVYFAIDEAILCKPSSVILIGWKFDPCEQITRMVFRSGINECEIDVKQMIRTDRSDVSSAFEDRYGRVDPRCGFVIFLPDVIGNEGDNAQVEINTRGGNLASQDIPEFRLAGLNAIKKVLGSFSVRYTDVEHAFACVGPGVQMLNADRIAHRPQISIIDFGPQSANPLCSVIVPIYGRCDFLEYQTSFFSETDFSRIQLIYVLDDPPRRGEFLALAESAFARFRVPFQTVLLSDNVGFAPANNIGLEYSRGEFICFLNSDVMPGQSDWLLKLIANLEQLPSLGIVGPLLLFEDETIQHAGMAFQRLYDFAGWFFPRHLFKGWLLNQTGLQLATAITGACMVMQRDLAQKLGGFDETFIIGDFEDSDLCLRASADLQRGCAVDTDIRMYHLDRQSQISSRHTWRMNITLFNAWIHQTRWCQRISESGLFND